jgi:galactokinase
MNVATGIAPGRLDFLGGVADYSGSLVLEMPLALTTRVTVRVRSGPDFEFISDQQGACTVAPGTPPASLPAWVRYSYGCLLYFSKQQRWRVPGGLEFRIRSTVPAGMGVSSSAALEVATMRALEKLSGRVLKPVVLAHLAQRVENEVVGAPCGLMDQLASSCGERGALLPILCRPDLLRKPVRLPRGVIAVGWPSGVKHDVGASPYATARAAAFMGKRIIGRTLRRRLGHVAEITPAELAALPAGTLPESITGLAFLQRWGGVDDPLSVIVSARRYPVRAAAAFPIGENARAHRAEALLRKPGAVGRADLLAELGELLYGSHAGYGAMGLGSQETDEMVEAIRRLGPAKGFRGARISGGGSGGTVVVLLDKAARPRLEALMRRLRFRRDFTPVLLA